jgi:hypothetical protein
MVVKARRNMRFMLDAADAFLAVYMSATEFTVQDVHDPLE